MQSSGAGRPHVALLASPGMGHLIPVLELGKRLIANHDISITIFVVSTDAATSKSLLKTCPSTTNLSIVPLPPVDISAHVEPSDHFVTKLIVMMQQSVSNLRSAISLMRTPPAALIVDIFGADSFSVADEFGMLKYAFITTTASFLAVTVYGGVSEDEVVEHVTLKKPLHVPGCNPIRFEDTLHAYLDYGDRVFDEAQKLGAGFALADGILINTWEDLEVQTLAALRSEKHLKNIVKAPVYPVGPLVRPSQPTGSTENNTVLEWLDEQPSESVIYVSFGSGGTLSRAQMVELAWGLELSGHRFIWVVRPPVDDDASAAFFSLGKASESDGPQRYLPEGFIARTNDRGMVVPMWAPQAEILAHESVGAFVSHCGWNSTLESITNGVPMVVWPLYAEQNLNAVLLTEELRVAVRPAVNDDVGGVVKRGEIENLVRKVMEGEEGQCIRERVKEVMEDGGSALSRKLNGSSFRALEKVAGECELNHRRVNAKAQGA
uniref:Glycosyltransferase n=1 Tax=Linum usitatissimum TaxID=4006 RepID=I2BH25_LINUS|nr:UDP-glycosyltransferase 1 [Linum usitatissimum]